MSRIGPISPAPPPQVKQVRPQQAHSALPLAALGFVAVLAGWVTTEAGRQPYTVYNLLRTADSVSPIAASAVGPSLVAFVVVYLAVFGAGFLYMLRVMAEDPSHDATTHEPSAPAPVRASGIVPGPAIADGDERSR